MPMKAGEAWVDLNLRSNLAKGFGKAHTQLKGIGTKLNKIGKGMTMGLTLPIVAAGGAVLKFGADFQKAMTESLAIVDGVTPKVRKEMEKTARDVAKTTRASAKEAAESYFYLASAGLDAAASMKALPVVAKFAQAGNFDMALATDLLTDAQSALGKSFDDPIKNMEEMTKLGDILVKANTLANASVQQFSESLTNRAAAALKMVNKDTEEGVAILAVFADQGVKGAEAGTRLDIVLRDLQTRAIKNKEAFKKYNVEVFDSAGKMKHTADIVGDLEKALDGKSDAMKRSILMEMGFQDRSISSLLLLVGNSKALREYDGGLRNAAGTMDSVAKKQMKNLIDQLGLIKDKLIDVAIGLSEVLIPIVESRVVPVIERFANGLSKIAKKFSALDPKWQKAILAGLVFAAALGPVLMILGKLISAIGAIAGALKFLTIPILLIVGKIALIVAAVTVFIAIFVKLYKKNEEFRNKVLKVWNHIKSAGVEIWHSLKDTFLKIWGSLAKAWDKWGKHIMTVAKLYWNQIGTNIMLAVSAIKNVILVALALIRGDWREAWDIIANIATTTWNTIKIAISTALDAIKLAIVTKLEEWKIAIIEWFVNMKDVVIPEKLEEWKTAIIEWFTNMKDVVIPEKFEEWRIAIIEWFESIPSQITTALDGWMTAIEGWATAQKERNAEKFEEWRIAIVEWFESIPGIITTQLDEWKKAITTWYEETKKDIENKYAEWEAKIKKWFENAPAKIKAWLVNWRSTLITWYIETRAAIIKKLDEWKKSIKAWFVNLSKMSEIRKSGEDVVKEIAGGTEDEKKDFIDRLGKLIVDVALAALGMALIALVAVGKDIIRRILEGIDKMKEDMKQAGRDIVIGLYNGINDKVEWIKGKIGDFVDSVKGHFKKLFGISSPSKWFLKMGGFMVDGLALGVKKKTPKFVTILDTLFSKAAEFGNNIGNIFAELPEKVETSLDDLIVMLENKLAAIAQWNRNLATIQRTMGSELANYLEGLGMEEAGIIEAVAGGITAGSTAAIEQLGGLIGELVDLEVAPPPAEIAPYLRQAGELVEPTGFKEYGGVVPYVESLLGRLAGETVPLMVDKLKSEIERIAYATGGLEVVGLANGGVVTSPTLAMVGEKGPEVVAPLSEMHKDTLITGNNFYIREEADIEKVARRLTIMREARA